MIAPLNQSLHRAHHDFQRPAYKPWCSAPVVFTRDFAYRDNGPIVLLPRRMAGGDVTSASAKIFAELLSGPVVDIYVGPEKRHWTIHRNLLCHHSSYFELEFSQHEVAQKNGGQHLDLLDDDPLGFELLVKWLYQGLLSPTSECATDEAKYDYAVACHKLWLLCDKFDMVRVKNLAMDLYRRCLNQSQLVPDADEINEIYTRSPAGSPFRALMVNIAARQIMDPDADREAEAYRKCFHGNPDFAIELVRAIRKMSGGMLFDDPTHGDPCAWHDHDGDGGGCPMPGKGKMRAKNDSAEGPGDIRGGPNLGPIELPAEKRTPRKLRTAPKSPDKAAAQSPAGSVPSKLTGPGFRLQTLPMRSLAVAVASEALNPNPGRPGTALAVHTLRGQSSVPNPSELSPLRARSSERGPRGAPSRHATQHREARPLTTRNGEPGQTRHPEAHAPDPDRSSTAASHHTDAARDSPSSRKRKRTPRKIREKQPVTLAASALSSRADSVASGPRKLRVNSMVRQLECHRPGPPSAPERTECPAKRA